MSWTQQCKAETWERAVGEMTQCRYDAGHEGDHTDGCLTWSEELEEQPLPRYVYVALCVAALALSAFLGALVAL